MSLEIITYKGDGKTTTFYAKFSTTALSVIPEIPYTLSNNTITFVEPPKKGQIICLKKLNKRTPRYSKY